MFARVREGVRTGVNKTLDKIAKVAEYGGVAAGFIGANYHGLLAMARSAATASAEVPSAVPLVTIGRQVAIASGALTVASVANIVDALNTANENGKVVAALARVHPPTNIGDLSSLTDLTTGLPSELTTTAPLTKAERVLSGVFGAGSVVLAIVGGVTIMANPVTGAALFFTSSLTFYGSTKALSASFHNEASRLNALASNPSLLFTAPNASAPPTAPGYQSISDSAYRQQM